MAKLSTFYLNSQVDAQCSNNLNEAKKSSVFWDITPCSLLKVNPCFGGTCHLHPQGQNISKERNQNKASSKPTTCFMHIPRCCRWKWHVPQKRQLTFSRLHSVISQDRTLHSHRCENLSCDINAVRSTTATHSMVT
jgi:hypothetical protein